MFQSDARDWQTLSRHQLRRLFRSSSTASRRSETDADDDGENELETTRNGQRRTEHSAEKSSSFAHGTQSSNTGSRSTTWMATLLYSLHFRLVDHNVIPASPCRPPPPQSLVYVLDSNLHPAPPTFGFSVKQETAISRSVSVVGQSANAVESSILPAPTSPPSSSLRKTAVNRGRRCHTPPPIPPKPSCLQSPPLAARYSRRAKTRTAEKSAMKSSSSSSMSRNFGELHRKTVRSESPPPPLPPLPARREIPPPTAHFRTHLERIGGLGKLN